ncbi:MAG: WD40 repeat domain-containing protein [Cryomorphaceae bacterium]|nr:MAG: WD40 repeat domain-containing protein [Cryomorphaceae bacterium]
MSLSIIKAFQLTGHSAGIYALTAGRSAHTVLTGSGDNMVAEWDLRSPQVLPFAIRLETTVYALKHLPKNRLAIGQGRGGIHIIDLENKAELRHLALHQKAVFDLHFLAPANQLISFSADGTFGVWDAESFELVRHIPMGDLKMRRASSSPDGQLLVTSGNDGRLRVFETEFFNEIHTFNAHDKSSNVSLFTPDSAKLISGGWDGHLRMWDVRNNFNKRLEIPAHNYAIYDMCFSPDGHLLATASRDKTVKIWDAETLRPLARLDVKAGGHSHSVNALHWNRETGLLVSAGDDRRLIGWEMR